MRVAYERRSLQRLKTLRHLLRSTDNTCGAKLLLHHTLRVTQWDSRMVSRVTLHVFFLSLIFLVLLVAGLTLAFGVFLRQRMSPMASSTAPATCLAKRILIHLESGLILLSKASAIVK